MFCQQFHPCCWFVLARGRADRHAERLRSGSTSPSTTPTPAAVTTVPSLATTHLAIPGTGGREALGTNNPVAGDCTTNTSEVAAAVGFVVLSLTPSAFQAEMQVQEGSPSTTYGVFMQQVPGLCPQSAANGGTLITDATGHGSAIATVPRVSSATSFFVQLVPAGSGPPEYTSDRISVASGG